MNRCARTICTAYETPHIRTKRNAQSFGTLAHTHTHELKNIHTERESERHAHALDAARWI